MLTSTQQEAVQQLSQPLCVKAGPGTGKTMLLVEKIAHIIENDLALPTQILSLTFTQKAAKEIATRVEKRTQKSFVSYTFHSFALSILQALSKEPESIRVLKDVDSIHFLLQKIKEYGYDNELKKDALFLAKEFYKTINSLKDQGISKQNISLIEFSTLNLQQHFVQLYTDYEMFKRKHKVVDFHDLEIRLFHLISKKDRIAQKIASLYPYIIIDEFQDTSPLQCNILEIIAKQPGVHITVVGDEKQSIYGFRGTHTNSFEAFYSQFSNSKTLYLQEQFRSSRNVVNATNKFIYELVNEEAQQLKEQLEIDGNVSLIQCRDEQEQFSHILSRIQTLQEENNKIQGEEQEPQTLAILARTHSQLKEFIEYASQYGISISYGQEDIFHNPAIEKVLNYLHIIANPKQSEKYIFSLFETLPIAQSIPQFILHQAKSYELDIYTFFKRYGINPKSRPLQELYETYSKDIELVSSKIKTILKLIEEYQLHKRIKKTLIDIMQEEELYEKALEFNDSKIISNYNSLLTFTQEYERMNDTKSMSDFLSYLKTAKDLHHNILDSSIQISSYISAMTIHQAKGKEFDRVCILNCTDKSYPLPFKDEYLKHQFSITKEQAYNEEKRLFFVALSRAKQHVDICTLEFNSKGTPLKQSPFIATIEQIITPQLPLKHSLHSFNSSSKELLSKLIYAMQREDFTHAKELFKEYELSHTNSTHLLQYDDNYVKQSQIYQKKDSNGDVKERVYSVSQIKTYQQCPKKYYYQYICKIPQEPKYFFSFGTSMHQVFELLMPLFEKNHQFSRDEIILHGLHLLSMHWRSLGYESVMQEREYFQKALRSVEDFVDLELKRREEGVKNESQEEEFIIEVGEKKHKLLGYIDRIDTLNNNKYTIIDYKTSKSMAYMSQLREDLQLYTYALALKQLKGVYPHSMALWYVIHNRIAQVEFKEEVMEKVEQRIIEGVEAIESNNFEAQPSFFNCTYCDFKDICKDSLK
ncbi:MAG: ATP-dependent helicase [Candidatus Nanoarchaeia archaeon]